MQKVDKVPDDAVEIDGYPGYFICRNGDVYSERKRKKNYSGPVKMKISPNRQGYLRLNLTGAEGKTRIMKVHRMLAVAFIGKPENKFLNCVRHLDDIKTNNDISNLAWGTKNDNEADKTKNNRSTKGERNPSSKLTNVEVSAIRRLYGDKKMTQREIGDLFSVSNVSISKIINRKHWKHI